MIQITALCFNLKIWRAVYLYTVHTESNKRAAAAAAATPPQSADQSCWWFSWWGRRSKGMMELGKWAEFHKFSGLGNCRSFPENLKFSRKRGVSCKREVFTKNWKFQANLETGIFFRNWEWTQNLKVLSEPGSSLRNLELNLKLGVSWELEVNSETGSFPRNLKFLSETGSFLTDCGSCLENWEFFPESEIFFMGNW